MRYGWKNLDMVCTVSEFSKKEILNKFHFKNILITPNCIDDFIKSIDIELKIRIIVGRIFLYCFRRVLV